MTYPFRSLYPSPELYPGMPEDLELIKPVPRPARFEVLTDETFQAGIVNELADPGFESGAFVGDYIEQAAGVDHRHGVSRNDVIDGAFSYRFYARNAGALAEGDTVAAIGWTFPVTGGEPLSVGVLCGYATTTHYFGRLQVRWLGSGGAILSSPEPVEIPAPRDPERLVLEDLEAVGGASHARVELHMCIAQAPAPDGGLVFDDAIATKTEEVYRFFDGESALADWSGPRLMTTAYRIGEAPSLDDLRELAPAFYFGDEQ